MHESLLGEAEISLALRDLGAGWERSGATLRKTYEFRDFVEAMAFVTKVALLAESANHHPDIDIRWNRVLLVLSTHSAGGLTRKDTDLALRVEQL